MVITFCGHSCSEIAVDCMMQLQGSSFAAGGASKKVSAVCSQDDRNHAGVHLQSTHQ